MIHELKTWTQYFQQVKTGNKTFEVRLNDRNYQVGDLLVLKEWLPELDKFTGDEITKTVTYILKGGKFGIEVGYVTMAIE